MPFDNTEHDQELSPDSKSHVASADHSGPAQSNEQQAVSIEQQAGVSVPIGGAANMQEHRLHPTSLLFNIMSHGRAFLFPALVALFGAASGNYFWAVIAGLMFIPALMISIFRYFTLRYGIRSGELIVTTGLLFRTIRTVPVRRIQNIDLVQNVWHRMLHVAEVRVETASGTKPEATLRVLSLSRVAELRSEVFEHRASQSPTEQSSEQIDPAVEKQVDVDPDGQSLLQIQIGWLVRAGLASNRGILIVGVLIGLFYQFDLEDRFDLEQIRDAAPELYRVVTSVGGAIITAIVVLLLLRLFGLVWYLLRFHNYRLIRHGDDLRISCGLLTKVSATLPRSRIQFISVHQNLFMKWMHLSAIRIETAGGAGKENENPTSTISRRWFVPVLPDDRVKQLLAEIRPGLVWNLDELDWQPLAKKAGKRLTRLAVMLSLVVAFVGVAITRPWGWTAGVVVLPLLVWFAAKKARSMRYARTDDGVVYRSGILNRKTSMTFFDKIQTLRIDQSPFDRRWKMAKLSVDTAAAGPADHRITVPLLDENFVGEEYLRLVDRAASASR